jgi:hypothetical protein
VASIEEIRDAVNVRAEGRPIGELQNLRKDIQGLQRKGSRHVFGAVRGIQHQSESNTPPEEQFPYTYHVGGREGLQFNIGIDPFGHNDLRYGIAFSLEPSMSYPSIEPILPKVQLFNDYLRQNPAEFGDLWMWHHMNGERSPLRRPTAVVPDIVQTGSFIFMGELARSDDPPYSDMLNLLDRLMPLWLYTETKGFSAHDFSKALRPLRSGRPERQTFASATLPERHLDINLRHNALQASLVNELIDEFGEGAVGWEEPAPGGGMIDVMVMLPARTILYEIKTAATARGCIREALGQLLDYGFWSGASATTHLCVVGEPEPDASTEQYLERLSMNFPAPISYRQITVD